MFFLVTSWRCCCRRVAVCAWNHVTGMLSCDSCVLLLQEFFHYAVGAVLVFIASIVAAVKSGAVSALVTASVCENTSAAVHQAGVTPSLASPLSVYRSLVSWLPSWWLWACGLPTAWPVAHLEQVRCYWCCWWWSRKCRCLDPDFMISGRWLLIDELRFLKFVSSFLCCSVIQLSASRSVFALALSYMRIVAGRCCCGADGAADHLSHKYHLFLHDCVKCVTSHVYVGWIQHGFKELVLLSRPQFPSALNIRNSFGLFFFQQILKVFPPKEQCSLLVFNFSTFLLPHVIALKITLCKCPRNGFTWVVSVLIFALKYSKQNLSCSCLTLLATAALAKG